jgi:hypothetical protein
MLLATVDAVLVYACFHPECTNTVPYESDGRGRTLGWRDSPLKVAALA